MYLFIDLVGFSVAFALTAWAFRRSSYVVNPAVIYSSVWIIAILGNQLFLDGVLRVDAYTLVLFFGVWWLFLAGILVMMPRRQELGALAVARRRPAFFWLGVLVMLHVVSIVVEFRSNPFLWNNLRLFTNPGEAVNALAWLRVTGQFRELDLPWFLEPFRQASLLYIPLAVLMKRQGHLSTTSLGVLITVGIIATFTHFTRAPALGLITATLVALVIAYPEKKKVFAVGAATLFGSLVVLFLLMQFILLESARVDPNSIWLVVSSYFGGPLRAYETILQDGYGYGEQGFYSLDMVNFVLYKLGMISDYPSLVREFVQLPTGTTNLYTYLDAFTLDAGIGGALLGALVFGLFSGFWFNKTMKKRSYFFVATYGLVAYYVTMSVANNELIRINFVLYLLIAAIVNLFVSHRLVLAGTRYRKEKSQCGYSVYLDGTTMAIPPAGKGMNT